MQNSLFALITKLPSLSAREVMANCSTTNNLYDAFWRDGNYASFEKSDEFRVKRYETGLTLRGVQ